MLLGPGVKVVISTYDSKGNKLGGMTGQDGLAIYPVQRIDLVSHQ